MESLYFLSAFSRFAALKSILLCVSYCLCMFSTAFLWSFSSFMACNLNSLSSNSHNFCYFFFSSSLSKSVLFLFMISSFLWYLASFSFVAALLSSFLSCSRTLMSRYFFSYVSMLPSCSSSAFRPALAAISIFFYLSSSYFTFFMWFAICRRASASSCLFFRSTAILCARCRSSLMNFCSLAISSSSCSMHASFHSSVHWIRDYCRR